MRINEQDIRKHFDIENNLMSWIVDHCESWQDAEIALKHCEVPEGRIAKFLDEAYEDDDSYRVVRILRAIHAFHVIEFGEKHANSGKDEEIDLTAIDLFYTTTDDSHGDEHHIQWYVNALTETMYLEIDNEVDPDSETALDLEFIEDYPSDVFQTYFDIAFNIVWDKFLQ